MGVKATFETSFSLSHRTLYSERCRIIIGRIDHGSSEGLVRKGHKDINMLFFPATGITQH
jgi:hypothetical protein